MKTPTSGRIEWTGIEFDDLVWKYPSDKFAFGSQLVIKENQSAAVFTKNRLYSRTLEIFDYFGDFGTHTLSLENLPLIQRTLSDVDKRSFHALIIFCRSKDYHLSRKVHWGESSGQAGVGCEADASCRFRIINRKLFLETLVAKHRIISDDCLLKHLSKTLGVELFSRYRPYGWDSSKGIGIGDWQGYGIELMSLQYENYKESFGAAGV